MVIAMIATESKILWEREASRMMFKVLPVPLMEGRMFTETGGGADRDKVLHLVLLILGLRE